MTVNPPADTPPRVDVAVIGAGPAGLAAAVRARWVKGHGAVPFRVAVFDPAPPGGLAGWKSNMLTGPAWRLDDEVPGRLLADCVEWRIPVVREAVESVRAEEEGTFALLTSAGRRVRADAVVLAAGLRRLCDERDAFGSRVSVAFQGADRFPALLAKAARAARAAGGPLALVGHGGSWALAPLVARAAAEAEVEVVWVLEDEDPGQLGARVARGRLESVGSGEDGGIRVRGEDGGEARIAAGHVFIDYYAFEARPSRWLRWEPDPSRLPSGHVRVDREGATDVPGLFAAGDCTGPYYAIARALGDGVTAGLSAWRHVFRGRFGREGSLFAYRPGGGDLADEAAWVPEVPGDFVVDPLVEPGTCARVLDARGLPGARLLAAPRRAAAWVAAAGIPAPGLWRAVFEARAATVRPTGPGEEDRW